MPADTSPPPQFHRDIRFSLCARGLYLLTRVALPPLILQHVGLAEYGLWSIAFIVVSYLGLSASGFASVYVRQAARAHQAQDVAALSRLLSTGICCLGLLSVLLLGGLWLALPWALAALGADPSRLNLTRELVLGCSAVFLADISLGAYAYVLQGIGRIRSEQKIWVAAYLAEMALAVILLRAGFGIHSLLAAFAGRYLLSISAAIRCAHLALPGLRLDPRLFERATLRHFLGFGALVQASAFCATALHSAERVLAGLLLGAPAAALFELGNKLPSTVNSIPSAVSGVTLPAASREQSRDERLALLQRATRITALLTALPMPVLACFALPVCQLWLGPHPEVAGVANIMSLLTLACQLHILTGPGTAVFRGAGSAANEFVYHALRVLCLALGILALWPASATHSSALAGGFSLGACAAALAYLAWNQHRLGGSLRALWQESLWPALAAYPAALLVALVFAQGGLWPPESGRDALLLPLALALACYTMLALLTLYALVLTKDERGRLRVALTRCLPHNQTLRRSLP